MRYLKMRLGLWVRCIGHHRQIPQETDFVSDVPRYFLYHEVESNGFYILKAGGFSGKPVELYGPSIFNRD